MFMFLTQHFARYADDSTLFVTKDNIADVFSALQDYERLPLRFSDNQRK